MIIWRMPRLTVTSTYHSALTLTPKTSSCTSIFSLFKSIPRQKPWHQATLFFSNPSSTSPADTFQNRTFRIHLINLPAPPTSVRSATYFGYRWSRTVMHFWKVRIRTWSICTFMHTWSLSSWFMWPGVKLPKSSLWTSNRLKFVTHITRWCEKNLFQGFRRLSIPLPALTNASKIMAVVKLHYDLRLVELFDMDEHYQRQYLHTHFRSNLSQSKGQTNLLLLHHALSCNLLLSFRLSRVCKTPSFWLGSWNLKRYRFLKDVKIDQRATGVPKQYLTRNPTAD